MGRAVLISGGGGFIGCHLAASLLSAGWEVSVLDSLQPQVHAQPGLPALLPEAVRFLPGDVTHAPTWDAVLRLVRPSTVVHLAAETGTGQSLTESTRHGQVNVVGTTQMLDAFHRADFCPEQIVLTSSRAVYGEGPWADTDGVVHHPPGRTHGQLVAGRWDHVDGEGRPLTPLPARAAGTEPRPANVYAATKLAQEHVLAAWTTAFEVSLSVLRLQNVYGPGQSLANPYTGVLTFFASRALAGEALDVYEDGRIVRDFVHVLDVVDALVRAVEQPPALSRTLDIGSGEPITILEAAQSIAAAAGAPEPQVSGRFRDGDVRAAWASVEDAASELGWKPQRRFAEGVSELLAWARH